MNRMKVLGRVQSIKWYHSCTTTAPHTSQFSGATNVYQRKTEATLLLCTCYRYEVAWFCRSHTGKWYHPGQSWVSSLMCGLSTKTPVRKLPEKNMSVSDMILWTLSKDQSISNQNDSSTTQDAGCRPESMQVNMNEQATYPASRFRLRKHDRVT